jgi:hypothetical protein
MRVMTKTSRQNSASSAPKPKFSCDHAWTGGDLAKISLVKSPSRPIIDAPNSTSTSAVIGQLGHERQRLFVDRSRGLDDADDKADRPARQQHRRGDQRGDPQHAVGQRRREEVSSFWFRPCASLRQNSLAARLPISSAQPSTSTNSSSLNGSETMVGLIIIMPRLISTDETTRSITRNGRNSMKPIWNAVLSSLVTKAGSRIEKGHRP